MTHEEVLKRYGGNRAEIARVVGVTRERVSYVFRKKRTLPADWQRAIEKDSKGRLKASVCKTCGRPLDSGRPTGAK